MLNLRSCYRPFKNRKHTGLLYRWFYSYIIVLLIPIFICSYYYIHTLQLVKKSTVENQSLLLEKTQNNIDKSFQQLNSIATKIQLMNSAVSLSYADKKILSPLQNSYVLSLQSDFHLFQVANTTFLNLSMYLPYSQHVIRSDTVYTTDLIPYMSSQSLSAEELDQLYTAFQSDTSRYTILSRSSQNGNLYYSRKLLTDTQRQIRSILIFELDSSYVKNILLSSYPQQENTLLVLFFQDICVFSTDPDALDAAYNSPLLLDTDTKTWSYGQTTYMIDRVTCNNPDIRLICLTPQGIYRHESDYLMGILAATILLCLSVGIITTYFYCKRNYKPVKQIMSLINPAAVPSAQDEYGQIMAHMIHSRNALSEQTEIMRNEFLRKLLSGEITYMQINDSVKEKFHFKLTDTSSAVCIIHIENYESFQNTVYQTEEAPKPISLLHFIIQNILLELLQDSSINIYFCYLHSDVAVICNANLSASQLTNALLQSLQQLLAFCRQHYQLNITIGISEPIADTILLSSAFTQAADALEYIHLFGGEPIFCWQKSLVEISKPFITGSCDTLMNQVLSGDLQNLTEYFRRMRRELSLRQLSLEEARDIIYFFYRTSLQIRSQIHRQYDTEHFNSMQNIDRGLFQMPFCDAINLIEQTYLSLAEELNHYKQSQKEQFSDTVCKYIDNNYSDLNLNLNNIALHFSMNSAYLSRRFKAEKNESVIDYLYRIRIEKATCLLMDKSLKISDIASIIGFQDSNAFIRIFKKEKGITPGKFRELSEKGNDAW